MNVIVICGPTATGKTQLALQLAEKFNGELISADSRQVYKGMDIITGKLLFYSNKQPQNYSAIHLYDVVSPDQDFSVAHFQKLASQVLKDIHRRKKLPIVVGGTGLYINALVEGIDTVSVPKNSVLRKELEVCSVAELQEKLQTLSFNSFLEMNYSDQNNPRRLIRKIEILTQPTINIQRSTSHYSVLWIGLTSDLETLKERVVKRVDQRIAHGAIEEVNTLLSQGYSWQLPSFKAIGYQEWREYFSHPNEENYAKARALWILHEQQYLKRQLTWFKRNQAIHWYNIQDSLKDDKINIQVSEFVTMSPLE